jgi:hypothetical protein
MELGLLWTGLIVHAASGYVLWRLWQARRNWSLSHALGWLAAAWLAWLVSGLAVLADWPTRPWRYVALAVTAGAGVAVFGARRPNLFAWDFVVAGLLAVLALPLLEPGLSAAEWSLDEPRSLFLALLLAVAVLNYLPTRWGPLAAGAGAVLLVEVAHLSRAAGWSQNLPWPPGTSLFLLGSLFWLGLLWSSLGGGRSRPHELTKLWREFRDSYGLVWGQRALEQFNSAAAHAGMVTRLGWRGVLPTASASAREEEALHLLGAVLKRFLPAARPEQSG